VFLSSTQHIRLKTGGLLDNDFLNRALLSYEATQPADLKEKNKLYKICMELEKFGLAYILLRPTVSKTKRIKIDIDQE
jgi:hypothetical protein